MPIHGNPYFRTKCGSGPEAPPTGETTRAAGTPQTTSFDCRSGLQTANRITNHEDFQARFGARCPSYRWEPHAPPKRPQTTGFDCRSGLQTANRITNREGFQAWFGARDPLQTGTTRTAGTPQTTDFKCRSGLQTANRITNHEDFQMLGRSSNREPNFPASGEYLWARLALRREQTMRLRRLADHHAIGCRDADGGG